MARAAIPVIDLFAGPGGLGEGFSAHPYFQVALSIEKDTDSYNTLLLRSFFRELERSYGKKMVPEPYYATLQGATTQNYKALAQAIEALYGNYPTESARAKAAVWKMELAKDNRATVDKKIKERLRDFPHHRKNMVLIGGPPCQAYSIIGRSRNTGNKQYNIKQDNRIGLYEEYVASLAQLKPAIFVLENVPGMLSFMINDKPIAGRIFARLQNPDMGVRSKPAAHYMLYSLVVNGSNNVKDFIVPAQNYGVPQSRRRVLCIGLRSDLSMPLSYALKPQPQIPVRAVLKSLPKVRSGLSHGQDSLEAWHRVMSNYLTQIPKGADSDLHKTLKMAVARIQEKKYKRGGEYLAQKYHRSLECLHKGWYVDKAVGGVWNHTTRGHIASDLHRYLYAACYAEKYGKSPTLGDFPATLLPHHKNVTAAIVKSGMFSDRFRVQVANKPAKTVTSHIAKDGHYYIHYDPTQCRSLTVREAARLQTFPDNYFFCGGRTAQYSQVGNAVPPYLAYQIAHVVSRILSHNRTTN